MSLKTRVLAVQEMALCLIRKWWRPLTCIWISLTMAVQGVVIPLWVLIVKGEAPQADLTGLSLLVTAIAGAFAVREWGKVKGTVE